MAASSVPSLRSSRRVAGLLAPAERSAPGKSKRDEVVEPIPKQPRRRVARSKLEPAFEMPPKKKQRVDAPAEKADRQLPSAAAIRRAQKARAQNGIERYLIAESPRFETPEPPAQKKQAMDEKRQLRSQGGASRIKSDLALFFPYYDEMISNEPKQPEFWTLDMTLMVVDDEGARPGHNKAQPLTAKPSTNSPRKSSTYHINGTVKSPMPRDSPMMSANSSYPKLHNTRIVDWSSVEKNIPQVQSDPLDDAFYNKAHRRAERREKQLRNIEKNKAQHEKSHLEQLLEGLRGPDWLKVMGISGITDSEKKEYEKKREFFIGEVAGLLEKFRAWKEEERRRKMVKDQTVLALEAAAEEEQASQKVSVAMTEVEMDVDDALSDGDPPDYSDVDAWAARQLHQEAISARGGYLPPWALRESPPSPVPAPPVEPVKPFTSFYSKPYLRAAAIGKHRRSGRSATAFGRPLPEVQEGEFELPAEILTPEARIASARRTRRLKRESKESKQH